MCKCKMTTKIENCKLIYQFRVYSTQDTLRSNSIIQITFFLVIFDSLSNLITFFSLLYLFVETETVDTPGYATFCLKFDSVIRFAVCRTCYTTIHIISLIVNSFSYIESNKSSGLNWFHSPNLR